jgi:hypothetical protein
MRHPTTNVCVLCELPTSPTESGPWKQFYRYHCQRCGEYLATFEAIINLTNTLKTEKAFLACASRQASEAERPITLTTDTIEKLPSMHAATSVSANLEKLLSYIVRRCPRPSQFVTLQETDYPVIDALDCEELNWYCRYGQGLGLLEISGSSTVSLTAAGWAHVRGDSGLPIAGRCFVAMAFREDLSAAYQDGIRAAIEDDCGLESVRMKELEHNEKICDRIIVEIRRSQFVVADFTLHRGGVYFEAGFAAALGRTVIWTCRDTDYEGLHFDTRQFNHIKWSEPADLRVSLAARIRATIPGAKLAPAGPKGCA